MKDNLDQECVKGGGGASILPGQKWTIATRLIFLEKKDGLFSVVTLLFRLSLPKIWLSHPHKNNIFEMSDNRVIR